MKQLLIWTARAVLLGLMMGMVALVLLMPMKAHATGNHNPPSPNSTATSGANSGAWSASHSTSNANAYGGAGGEGGTGGNGFGGNGGNGFGGHGGHGGQAVGGNASAGDYYVLPAPIAGSNLPSGMCTRSKYNHFSIGWNFLSVANGDSHTDMECLNAILTVQKFRAEAKAEPRLPPMTLAEQKEWKALEARVGALEKPKKAAKPVKLAPCKDSAPQCKRT